MSLTFSAIKKLPRSGLRSTHRLLDLFGSGQYPGYRDHSTRDMLANWEASGKPVLDVAVPVDLFSSAADDSGDSVVSVAPVVVAFLGRSNMLERVNAAEFPEVVE